MMIGQFGWEKMDPDQSSQTFGDYAIEHQLPDCFSEKTTPFNSYAHSLFFVSIVLHLRSYAEDLPYFR